MLIIFLPHLFAIISTVLLFMNITMINPHIAFAIASYNTLFAAFVLSFILSYQQQHLHNHNINYIINKLPALETTEKILFITIYIGFGLLSLAIINGILTIEDFFAQHLAHKTVFAVIAWVLLLVLIILHLALGLRDKIALRAVQLAFVLIMIGYVGTKIALALIAS